MGYRDEAEALRAKVASLERDLERANETIARLTGSSTATETVAEVQESAFLDGPALIRLERELPFAVSDEGYEAIAQLVRKRAPELGPVSQVGRTLSARGFSVSQREGKTKITMTGDYRNEPLRMFAGAALGGGFLSMIAFGIMHDAIVELSAANVLWMAPLFVGLVFILMRKLVQNGVHGRARVVRATFESVVELATRHAIREAPKVRIEAEQEEEVEVAAEKSASSVRS